VGHCIYFEDLQYFNEASTHAAKNHLSILKKRTGAGNATNLRATTNLISFYNCFSYAMVLMLFYHLPHRLPIVIYPTLADTLVMLIRDSALSECKPGPACNLFQGIGHS
jgi:hypothetical protein